MLYKLYLLLSPTGAWRHFLIPPWKTLIALKNTPSLTIFSFTPFSLTNSDAAAAAHGARCQRSGSSFWLRSFQPSFSSCSSLLALQGQTKTPWNQHSNSPWLGRALAHSPNLSLPSVSWKFILFHLIDHNRLRFVPYFSADWSRTAPI